MKTVKEKEWKNYYFKAKQFLATANDAFLRGSWNSVGLTSVHAAISANDAITVRQAGIRSAGENHHDAVDLLVRVFNNSKEARNASKHLSWLINRKNLIEYESRLFYEREADEALKHANRFVSWADGYLRE